MVQEFWRRRRDWKLAKTKSLRLKQTRSVGEALLQRATEICKSQPPQKRSYLRVKDALLAEFGEEAFAIQKHAVQNLMAGFEASANAQADAAARPGGTGSASRAAVTPHPGK